MKCSLLVSLCCLQPGPRPVPFVVKVLYDVARGLQSARDRNHVIHMDVKAANVVLDWDGPDSPTYVATSWKWM